MAEIPRSIGYERAMKLVATKWWETATPREIAHLQLWRRECICPLSLFVDSLSPALGRPVMHHELGCDWDGLCLELIGERDAPTMQQIVGLIPEDKRMVLEVGDDDPADWWK